MGRRVRHFNPVHAGAGFAIDARFLNYGNGANVTSWDSRPGATFNFGGASNYPTFISAVSAAANQPGVNFVRGSSQRLTASSVVIPSGSDTFTYVEFSTGGNGFVSFAQSGDLTRIGAYFAIPIYEIVYHRGYFAWHNATSVIQELNEGTYTNGVVAWARQNSTTQESGIRTSVMATRTSSGTLRGTNSSNSAGIDHRTGVHHASAAFSSALSDSLLRRIVHSYAFSFKSAT